MSSDAAHLGSRATYHSINNRCNSFTGTAPALNVGTVRRLHAHSK